MHAAQITTIGGNLKDNIDAFIIEHARSMTQSEMADKLQVNKSTISRRISALRESGQLQSAAPDAATHERKPLQGCAINRADRLQALAELREALQGELRLSGGQGLARVSSEYRKVLEEMESLSHELDLDESQAKAVDK